MVLVNLTAIFKFHQMCTLPMQPDKIQIAIENDFSEAENDVSLSELRGKGKNKVVLLKEKLHYKRQIFKRSTLI